MLRSPLVFILSLFGSLPVGAMADTDLGYTLCQNRKIVRTIRVEEDKDAKQFVTLYTKAGLDKEVGRARNRDSAEKFQLNIKGNLEQAGWSCREVSEYKVIHSASSP